MEMNIAEQIYEMVAKKTLERLKREKATKLSRKTLKMIALTEKLHKMLYLPN